jgi:hypothetical protein
MNNTHNESELHELIEIDEKLRRVLSRTRRRLKATSTVREVKIGDILDFAGRIRFTTLKTRKFQRDSFAKEPFPSVFEFRRAVAHENTESAAADQDEKKNTDELAISAPDPKPLTRRHSSNDSMMEIENDVASPRQVKRERRGGRVSLSVMGVDVDDSDDNDDDLW